MAKLYGILIIIGILGGVGYGAKYYYDSTQARISQLVENNATLEAAHAAQKDTINILQNDIKKNAELNRKLQKELQVAESYGDQLRATLQKHNLTHMANKRPKYIERKMQNATNRLWDCLADLTNPDGVFTDARTQSPNCNKNSKDGSSNSGTAKASPTK